MMIMMILLLGCAATVHRGVLPCGQLLLLKLAPVIDRLQLKIDRMPVYTYTSPLQPTRL